MKGSYPWRPKLQKEDARIKLEAKVDFLFWYPHPSKLFKHQVIARSPTKDLKQSSNTLEQEPSASHAKVATYHYT